MLDLSLQWRFTNLPNNAKLEMVPASRSREGPEHTVGARLVRLPALPCRPCALRAASQPSPRTHAAFPGAGQGRLPPQWWEMS